LWQAVEVLELLHLDLQVVAQVELAVYWRRPPRYFLALHTQSRLALVVRAERQGTTSVSKVQILSFLE
jgi:hypothetical protein